MKTTARRGDRGVVLILTLFVLFLVIALIAQLSLGAEVAHQATMNRSNRLRMNLAIRSASEEILTMIKDDATGDASGGLGSALGGMEGMTGALGDSGSNGFGDAAAESGYGDSGSGEEEEGDGEEDASNSDSFEDTWARPLRVMMDDIEVTTFVQDENSKFNLHLLLVEDEQQATENYERAVRILDYMREDMDDDLGETDARVIIDDILRWMQVGGRNLDLPQVPRHSLEDEDEYAMLSSLEELMLLDSITPALYYDQLGDFEIIAPGLETVFTIWTTPTFDGPGTGSLADDAATTGSDSADPNTSDFSNTGDTSADPSADPNAIGDQQNDGEMREGEGGMEGVLEGDPPLGTKVNLNTAPRAVLEGMFSPQELSPAKVERLIEWLDEVDEEALEEQENAEEDSENRELRQSLYGELEPEPKKFLKTLEELAEVDGFGADELDEETQARVEELVGVQSDVFSIYVYASRKINPEWQPEHRYQEPPGHSLRMRAVVWRRTTADGVKLVFLEPWHEVPFTRWRIPPFQRDLPVFVPPRYY
ncbi:MAG: type II secretion system protein GspK [Planctomycetota bacterium]|nr:type II secretion system protein GspK [Planctomycetota bacterium]